MVVVSVVSVVTCNTIMYAILNLKHAIVCTKSICLRTALWFLFETILVDFLSKLPTSNLMCAIFEGHMCG